MTDMTPRDWAVVAVNAIGAMAIMTAIVYAIANKIINLLRNHKDEEE